MLSCANGEAVTASMIAMVRAPNPNVASVHSCRPYTSPILGSDRMVPATAIQNRTAVTEYSVSCLLNIHIAAMAMIAPVCRSTP